MANRFPFPMSAELWRSVQVERAKERTGRTLALEQQIAIGTDPSLHFYFSECCLVAQKQSGRTENGRNLSISYYRPLSSEN
jgi:hypothetical protein